MARLITLSSFSDTRGSLNVIENSKELPFDIQRVYYIYDVKDNDVVRGGHRHKVTVQALICIHGTCDIYSNNGKDEMSYSLNSPDKCLILEPEDWHTMKFKTKDTVLLVLASEKYSKEDYIDEPYN